MTEPDDTATKTLPDGNASGSSAPPPSAPAGWYPDPQHNGQRRYWDGASWSEDPAPIAPGDVAPGAKRRRSGAWWPIAAVGAALLLIAVAAVATVAILQRSDASNASANADQSKTPAGPAESPSTPPAGTSTTGQTAPTPMPQTTTRAPGYGRIYLGMSIPQLAALGITKSAEGLNLASYGPGDACPQLDAPSDPGQLVYDPSGVGGVVEITYDGTMTTPEGIRLGSTNQALLSAYPDVRESTNGFYIVKLSGNTEYVMGLDPVKKNVTEIHLVTADNSQNCFELG